MYNQDDTQVEDEVKQSKHPQFLTKGHKGHWVGHLRMFPSPLNFLSQSRG